MKLRAAIIGLLLATAAAITPAKGQGVFLGTNTPAALYLGTNVVSAVYLGTNVVWTSAPTPDLVVTGTLDPNVAGDFFDDDAIYNDEKTYKLVGVEAYLWFEGSWYISETVGIEGTWFWVGGGGAGNPVGTYTAYEGATGTATVSAP